MSDLISIIIPIYNSKATLDACLQSINNQTYTNLEILLVDDGSSDGSLSLCNLYSERDSRIKVLHQDNKGPSAARNLGLSQATGDYISFLDSDDEIECSYFETLLGMIKASKADVSAISYSIEPRGEAPKQIRKASPIESFDSNSAISHLLYQNKLDSSQCMKLYSKEILSGITFDENICVYEDLLFVYQVYKRCKKIVWSNRNLYFYHKEQTGQMDQKSPETEDSFYVMDCIKADIQKETPSLVKAIDNRIISVSFNIIKLLAQSGRCNSHIEELCWSNIKRLRKENFLDSKVRIKNKAGIIISCFGKGFTRWMFANQLLSYKN